MGALSRARSGEIVSNAVGIDLHLSNSAVRFASVSALAWPDSQFLNSLKSSHQLNPFGSSKSR